jgi:hypothetical protein
MNLAKYHFLKLSSQFTAKRNPEAKMATHVFVRRDNISPKRDPWENKDIPAVNGYTWLWFEAEKLAQEKCLYQINMIFKSASYQPTWRGTQLKADNRFEGRGWSGSQISDHWNKTTFDNPQIVATTLQDLEDMVAKRSGKNYGLSRGFEEFMMDRRQPFSAIHYSRFLPENNAGKPPTLTVVG